MMMHKLFNIVSSSSSSSSSSNPNNSNSSESYMTAKPLRLVYCDDNGKFKIDPEAIDALSQVKGPVGVVSVCGRARQGKSFILNQLLGRSSGFQVASTHRPCTKGLWMWSAPLKRNALDGTEYNLILLDSEGIDAYDQTGTYSTQIFSLAVLLSSMFIYNQMGGIDESALDRLSLVTEMTKHIRVGASGGRDTVSELGQFSPVFVWLLRDFYLDLADENVKITPRDYLEIALRPVQGGGKDIAAKNGIRESIRALFPDRECFTLVRPLNNETDLQRLDQISFDKFRPEFRSGLDALTKFVFERTRTKQVGGTIMTGPILVGITKSYLDALNNGVVPTISSSWQSVEESECRRAYDIATEVYMSAFDHTKPLEEVSIREAHDEAVQKSITAFSASAVGSGSAMQKYKDLLQNFIKKAFEEYRRNAFMEADLRCLNAIQTMDKKLVAACQVPDGNIDHVLKVLDSLLSTYEASIDGPTKWQKLFTFLQQSLQGPILNHAKKQLDQVGAEKNALMLKCNLIEDKTVLLNKQLEASEKFKTEYQKHYEDAINDMRKIADQYKRRITDLESTCSSLEERGSTILEMLHSSRQESVEWKRKYEEMFSSRKIDDGQANAEIEDLKSRSSAAEARVAAAHKEAHSAQQEAYEWKQKYDIAVREAKAAKEKAATMHDCSNKQVRLREDALRSEFSRCLAEKEEEIKDKVAKLKYAEQHLTTLRLELKAAEANIMELSSVKHQIEEMGDKFKIVEATAQSFERKALTLEEEKNQLEHKYLSELKRSEEAHERSEIAAKEVKRANEFVDSARAELITVQNEKNNVQQLAIERLAQIERAQRHIKSLERQKMDLMGEIGRYHVFEADAKAKVTLLETRVKEREEDMGLHLKFNYDQRGSVQVLENRLEAEHAAHLEAKGRAEALFVQLQATQEKLGLLQQELTLVHSRETTLYSNLKSASPCKRSRLEVPNDSIQDMEIDEEMIRGAKRTKSSLTPRKCTTIEYNDFVPNASEDQNKNQKNDSEDYTKFTVPKLRQELTNRGFGAELLGLKTPKKKDILALYKKHVLQN